MCTHRTEKTFMSSYPPATCLLSGGHTHTHSAKTHSLSNPVLPLAAPQTKATSVPGFGGRKDKKCKVPSSLPLFLVGATGTSNCGTAGLPKWTHLLPTAKLKDGFEKGPER